jgi:hypothetical protein
MQRREASADELLDDVPPSITPALLSNACGWTRKKAAGEMRRAGVLRQKGRFYDASSRKMKERMPDEYERVYRYCVLGERPRKVKVRRARRAA